MDLLTEFTPIDTETVASYHKTAIWVCMIQVLAAYLCYIFGESTQKSESYKKFLSLKKNLQ